MHETVTPPEALDICKNSPHGFQWLDVRSEGEFEKGQLPHSLNIPILNNDHRHQVGLAYKTKGQEFAIELGHKLVDPLKNQLLKNWQKVLEHQQPAFVFCWRGGLRSKMTQQWIKESGHTATLVLGGYKAIRNILLEQLSNLPPLLILSGQTGSHKTVLLNDLHSTSTIDLEGLANHRGSAFGLELGTTQPNQATFENHLLLELYKRYSETLLEDESQLIGNRRLPKELYTKMSEAPRVVITMAMEERCSNIVTDYVQEPLDRNPQAKSQLEDYFLLALSRIKDRLGGVLHQDISKQVQSAFSSSEFNFSAHASWVSSLLENYYDKAYNHSFQRKKREVIFQGSYDDCKDWLHQRLDSNQQ